MPFSSAPPCTSSTSCRPASCRQQDKQYLISFAQLPQGATLDRTEAVIRKMSDIAMKDPDVESAVAFPGLSINGFTNSSSAGIVFVTLKPFEQRTRADQKADAIVKRLNAQYVGIQDAFILILNPPAVLGIGTAGGYKLQIEDRTAQGNDALNDVLGAVLAKAARAPELYSLRELFRLRHQRPAALRQCRPDARAATRRLHSRRLRHAPNLSRLALRE